MTTDNQKEPRKKIYRIGAWICAAIALLFVFYLGYYKYQQNKLKFHPEGFSVQVNSKDLTASGKKWLEAYTERYRGKYVPKNQKVVEQSIDNLEIKEANVLQIDFSIKAKKLDEKTSANWNGTLEENKVKCQWVLWFKVEEKSDGTFIYTATRFQRPAGYDLEKYQTSGQKERDEYKQKYEAETPYEKQQYTYKIENKICYVSYDGGTTWKEVPVPLKDLVEVGDGRAYYNKLQEKSYVITPEKTAFVYGGTREKALMITYSEDKGSTWKTSEISKNIDSIRVKFCSFPKVNVSYVIATSGRAMSQEGQTIFKTTDGGSTWKEAGVGPSSWLLQSAGFVEENLGFMSYPKVQGGKTNFYRTEDGGKTFEPVMLPVNKQEWMGLTSEPFIQPQTPYIENGQMFLLVGQGEQGDFKGGTIMAKYKSEDKGKTWTFVELVEPPSKERG